MKVATQKQHNMMYKFTLLKFWEVDSPPPPTIDKASAMISNMIDWAKVSKFDQKLADGVKEIIVDQVQEYFPSWNGDSLKNRFYGRKKSFPNGNNNDQQEEEIPEPEQKPQPMPEPKIKPEEKTEEKKGDVKPEDKKEEPKPKEEPKKPELKTEPKKPHPDPTIDSALNRIKAGLRNFYFVGPAGTGKTTICKELGKLLDMPVTILSCNSGTSPAEITGFKYPEPRASVISAAIGQRGIIVFDEITMLDASVAAAANALLANGEIYSSVGRVVRDPDCIIIATANTIGDGANRVYIGNNQLDASTLDRFVGGFINVDYNIKYELDNFDNEVCYYIHGLRSLITANGFRRIASTRTIIACDKLKKSGMFWKDCAIAQWSDEEKQTIKR